MSFLNKIKYSDRFKGYMFLLPNIFGFLLFTFIPVLASLGYSFTDWNGFISPSFIGFTNFIKMFQNSTFRISFWNTIYYTGISVPFTLALALLVAILLNNKINGLKYFRTAFFMPYISASVAIAVVWQLLYHPNMGPVNAFLQGLGITEPPRWLSSTSWALTAVIIVSIWRFIGYYMIIFLAGLQGIPDYLYEAARIDGANTWQQFWKITIPMLSPTIFFALIIAIIKSFKVFDLIYILTEGGPGRSTNVLAYTIYQEAFVKYKFGYASAMAYILFIMIMIVTVIQFRGQRKWVSYM